MTIKDTRTVMTEFWQHIDAQEWDAMAALLDTGLSARFVHTGEVLGAGEFVLLNSEYPGRWRAILDDLVVEGERAVSRATISDGDETHHAASFATVLGGRITELVEVWAEAGQLPEASRRPASES